MRLHNTSIYRINVYITDYETTHRKWTRSQPPSPATDQPRNHRNDSLMIDEKNAHSSAHRKAKTHIHTVRTTGRWTQQIQYWKSFALYFYSLSSGVTSFRSSVPPIETYEWRKCTQVRIVRFIFFFSVCLKEKFQWERVLMKSRGSYWIREKIMKGSFE